MTIEKIKLKIKSANFWPHIFKIDFVSNCPRMT